MNIKIGNDIRLNVVLNDKYSFELTDIKKIKAYLTNTSTNGVTYPNSSYPLYYNASGFNTNLCGIPSYYTLPYDNGFNGYYTGFGYSPRHTHAYNNCNTNSFLAPHTLNKEEGSIQVYFPASQQLAVGTYKLTLVIEVYEYGWCNTNTRVYSYDYNNVFTLTEDGIDGDQIINTDGSSPVNSLQVTAIPTDLIISGTSLLRAVAYRKDDTTSILTKSNIIKTTVKCYNADGSISQNQGKFTFSYDDTAGYYGLITNVSASIDEYCLVTSYYSDDPTKFDTVKITSLGQGTSSQSVVTNITVNPTSAEITQGGSVNINSVVTGENLTGGINIYY